MKKSEVLAIAGARELRKGEMKSVGGGILKLESCSVVCYETNQPCYYLDSCIAPGSCAFREHQGGWICVPH